MDIESYFMFLFSLVFHAAQASCFFFMDVPVIIFKRELIEEKLNQGNLKVRKVYF